VTIVTIVTIVIGIATIVLTAIAIGIVGSRLNALASGSGDDSKSDQEIETCTCIRLPVLIHTGTMAAMAVMAEGAFTMAKCREAFVTD
jgi:hypothetical protein